MKKLIGIIKAVFPEVDETKLSLETLLESIPGWDSMTAVNLLIELEQAYTIDLSEQELQGTFSLSILKDILRRHGATIEEL